MIKFAPLISIYGLEGSKDIQNEVIWTFSSNLKGVGSVRQRFNIHVVEKKSEERCSLEGSIKSIWRVFDLQHFLICSKKLIKSILLDFIVDSLLEVSNELGWKRNEINKAKEQSVLKDIEFFYSSIPINNSTGNVKAHVELELIGDRVLIWIVFLYKKSNKVVRKHLIDTSEAQISWYRKFKEPRWISSEQFGFVFEDGIILSMNTKTLKKDWIGQNSLKYELFKKEIDYNYNLTSEERARLMNW